MAPPLFLLDAFRSHGIDKPVLLKKNFFKENKKTEVEKCLHVSG